MLILFSNRFLMVSGKLKQLPSKSLKLGVNITAWEIGAEVAELGQRRQTQDLLP